MNNKQYAFKALLIMQTVGLLLYTMVAMQNDGFNFLQRAQEFVLSMQWMGQFALDFQCYLTLSALWIAWRNQYTGQSIVLAISGMVLGIIIFAPYLLYLLYKENGDVAAVLVGGRKG